MKELEIYPSPFCKRYWKEAIKEFSSLKNVVLIGLLIALQVVVGLLYIPVTAEVRIKFDFIVSSLIGMIFGPLVGMVSGAISDVLSFVIHPTGPFFIGYTLTSALAGFIYGIFFYRTKIKFCKLIAAKLIVNMVCNAFLGTLWYYIYMSKDLVFEALITSFWIRFTKNIVLLPLEVMVIYTIFKQLFLVLETKKLIVLQDPAMKWF